MIGARPAGASFPRLLLRLYYGHPDELTPGRPLHGVTYGTVLNFRKNCVKVRKSSQEIVQRAISLFVKQGADSPDRAGVKNLN
jgi:hypothetical protein